MADSCHIYLFGDQTFDYTKSLRDLVHSRSDPFLEWFFEKTYYELRTEISTLAPKRRAEYGKFSNFAELTALKISGDLHPVLDQALSCAYQLASFISQHNSQYESYPKPTNSYVIGLCTGELAAAAVASSSSTANLLPAAVHSVIVAFRTGLRAEDVARSTSVEAQSDLSGDWSLLCVGLAIEHAERIIEEFASDAHLPLLSRPYISACSDSGTTISGPPAVLSAFRNCTHLDRVNAIPLKLKLPYHAPHLFCEEDVDFILSSSSPGRWSVQTAMIPTISPSTSDTVWATNFGSLLRAAVIDILLKQLRWDNLSRRLAAIASSAREIPISVKQYAMSADNMLRAALKQEYSKVQKPRYSLSAFSVSNSSFGNSLGRPEKSKIAIIGASGRFPGAEDMSSFWDLLSQGLDVHKPVPPLHWDAKTHVDLEGKRKNTSATPFGCWLEHPDLFDARFFNISPREAPQIDPAQRLALMTAYEAIEEAGITPNGSAFTQKERVGVFYGVTSNDWMETNSAQNIDTYFIPGGNRAFIPGRINYFFNFSGPSYSVDTACSSSLAAIHLACNALWRGEIDTAISGGTNVLTNPDFTAGLDKGHFLSRTGNCRTFDASADGYCRGEGIATVILKRLDDALIEKDPIQAVISGAYTNHSAEAESITRPHVAAQEDIFRKVLNGAGVEPYDIGYIEMHGTGTQAGDNAEMNSVLGTFAPCRTRLKRNSTQSLYVGSAKSNIGHGEAASGACSLAKLLLMLKHETIPPHCGIKTKINPRFPTDLKDRQVFIADKPTPWVRPESGVRKAFLNNFSAAGGNTALLLEDVPPEATLFEENEIDPRSTHMVAVSAKCTASLQGNATALLAFMSTMNSDELSNLSYTTTARRIHHPHRIMVCGIDLEKVKMNLKQAIDFKLGFHRPKAVAKLLFTFTGQGAAYLGMARQLVNDCVSFRNDIDRLDLIAKNLGFPTFKPIYMLATDDISDYSPVVTQLAIVCMEIALARLWISWGVQPSSVLGHSLGEYAALNIAGVISDMDTVYLVGHRAQLLQKYCAEGTHSMLAIRTSEANVTRFLASKAGQYEVACVNGPEDVVISGTVSAIQDAQQTLTSAKIRVTVLNVPFAFHSTQIDPILPELEELARGLTFHKPTIPVLSPLRSSVCQDEGVFGPLYVAQHCRKAVNTNGAVLAAQRTGLINDTTLVVEIGPHPVVSGMIKASIPAINAVPSLRRKSDDWEVIAQSLTTLYNVGVDILWREYHRDFMMSQRVLKLPAYSWDLKSYWMQYVNDWSLRKGEPSLVPGDSSFPLSAQPTTRSTAPKAVPSPPMQLPRLQSTTIHSIVEEKVTQNGGSIILESDVSRPDLNPFVQGHKVNGIPLCTPSVYADIAFTVGRYLQERYWPEVKDLGITVAEMTIMKALIATASGAQPVRTVIKLDASKRTAECRFQSFEVGGKFKCDHATCVIRFRGTEVLQHLEQQKAGVKVRMANLREGLTPGKTYIFNRAMIYKMIASLANFDPKYRGLNQIILDSPAKEASSIVDFAGIKEQGSFHTNPAFIDGLSQSAGFVMNCNDDSNLDVEVFVNHGWKSLQLFEKISTSKQYQTHVTMSEKAGKAWVGDVIIFDGDKLVGIFEGIVLQGCPRRLLGYILASERNEASGAKKSVAKNDKTAPSAPVNSMILSSKPSSAGKAAPAQPEQAPSASAVAPLTPQTAASQPIESITDAKKTKVKLQKRRSEATQKVLAIISEESGIAEDDFTDDTVLADSGIDSLLSLMIVSRLREEINVNIDDSAWSALETVKDLKDLLGREQDEPMAPEDTSCEEDGGDALTPAGHPTPAPPASHVLDPAELEHKIAPLKVSEGVAISETSGTSSELWNHVLQIISEETGIAIEELSDDTVFTDSGVDSLLSLMITSRFSEELDTDIHIDSSLFADCATLKELKNYLVPMRAEVPSRTAIGAASVEHLQSSGDPNSASSPSSVDDSIPRGSTPDTSDGEDFLDVQKLSVTTRRASSIILQGRPGIAKKTLFLFPDGVGSAHSYTSLPKVHDNVAVFGLNCPFVRHPQEMVDCSLDALVDAYINEVKRRQPQGIYNLGGWSAGGILAYRAAQVMMGRGDKVESLVLIDSPVPKGLDRLPQRFYDHCKSIGLFGKASPNFGQLPTEQLFAHFNGTIEVLHDYHAKPLVPKQLAKVTIIWATECVMDGVRFPKLPPGPGDTEGMKFLTEKRTNFSADGWEAYFPGVEIDVKRADNAHHFSMLQQPYAQTTSRMVCGALGL
ncbi:conidial pigment polyketide synthase PksP/Alb1 [Viridothelium virens]|uniref:Conidial pigment polyketide synthase PksP/Alb1 n=1 Tax=Viridothelium virens TaxID=1048519 RepID=A0A6A6GVZ8_VIRVR|nr:conidial pigment polyketide synthase PksP/Alb1 [Viridothelium virens]